MEDSSKEIERSTLHQSFSIHMSYKKNGDINMQQIRSSGNVTDLFTKSPSIATFKKMVHKIGMQSFDYESIGFDENRSKHRNDPHTMKKLRPKHAKNDKKKEIHDSKKRGSNNSASKAPAKRRKVVEVISRDEFPKELSCVIKEIPPHSLRFESSCNLKVKDDIKEVVGQEVLGLFENTICGCYLNISLSNYIGQLTKCLLILEIEQPNQEEMHVFIKGNILRFFIYEFSLISDLNYFSNVEDFNYDSSSSSRLIMRKYFPRSTNEVDKEVDMKFSDLERVMNDRFYKVLKSLQLKNKTVEKENVAKQSLKEGQHSDNVADFEDHRRTSTYSPVKETNKLVEMDEDKVNPTPSPFKNGEQHEKIIDIHYVFCN
ncbi:hypothetical protein BC332_31185 [Capsicum chinense]|nr:hypothetical protein BC332_31185 [Capsicum chinense]